MGTHDPKDIDEEVNSSWKLVSHLENEFCDIPAARELVINVREKIEEFKSKMLPKLEETCGQASGSPMYCVGEESERRRG